MAEFELLHTSKKSKARVGELKTAHGKVKTPFFMTIATRGAVKTLAASDMEELGAEILLANTYHLFVRPGVEVIKKAGGLHKFMGWDGPILTDSGGYQVFSLAAKNKEQGARNKEQFVISTKRPKGARGEISPATIEHGVRSLGVARDDEKLYDVRITADGSEFIDRLSGRKDMFTPERVLEIQQTFGVDIAMVLDVCAPYPVSKEGAREAMEMTSEWARRSRQFVISTKRPKGARGEISSATIKHGVRSLGAARDDEKGGLVFGIIQGSVFKDLREQSAREITALNFDGYAIGGVAVGESAKQKRQVVQWVVPHLPENQPRYLMGLGQPEEIVAAVQQGIDMFDCVLPTRNARHGSLYTWRYSKLDIRNSQRRLISNIKYPISNFYQTLHITNEQYRADFKPVDPHCTCFTCTHHSRAYLRHLFKTGEPLAARLATIHNVKFYLDLMKILQDGIAQGHI